MKWLFTIILCQYSLFLHAQELSQDRIVFRTNYGDMVVALYPEVAPEHTRQILHLAEKGAFNQTSFYRLEKGFVAQIENHSNRSIPLSPKIAREVIPIPAEFSDIKHRRGHLSMARYDEDVNSAESSFSFVLGDAPHLDGQYTVFGEVVAGLDVLEAIESVSVDSKFVPYMPIFIRSTSVISETDLAKFKLSGVLAGAVPYDPYTNFFKAFAAIAFALTVAQPFVRSFMERRVSN